MLGWVRGNAKMQDPAALMLQNDEHEQDPERRGWHDKEINRCQTFQVVSQECQPSLRWRLGMSHHVLRNGCLTGLDTQLEQLAVDPWRTPQDVVSADALDQALDGWWNRRPSWATRA